MSRVVVVGAGPAGSAAAMSLVRFPGVEVTVVERARLPRTKVCGSGLSPWALSLLDRIGAGAAVRRAAYPIHGAVIGGATGRPVELRGKNAAAVLLRERLDALLAGEAVARGARLVEGTLVRAVENGAVLTDAGAIECDAVVDASGAKTRISRSPRPGTTLHAILGWYEGVAGIGDAVELYFDPVVRPYYGWVFPEGPDRVNIGLCYGAQSGGPNARERFAEFLDTRLAGRLGGATRLGDLVGHPISTTHRPTRLSSERLLVAGEAGRLVDTGTAEGIHHAIASGWTAGSVLGRVLERGERPTAEALAPYTSAVRREVGGRLLAGRALRGLVATPVFDLVLALASRRPVQAALTRVLEAA